MKRKQAKLFWKKKLKQKNNNKISLFIFECKQQQQKKNIRQL